jgi:hypothetical protein
MKKNFTLSALLLLSTVIATSTWAQNIPGTKKWDPIQACFNDGYATFYFPELHSTYEGAFYARGTMDDPGNGVQWTVYIAGHCFEDVHMRVINPRSDNCITGYTDSFHYDGYCTAAYFDYLSGATFYFEGFGNWTSYCSGNVNGTGTWVMNDCDHKHAPAGANAAGPARSNSNATNLLRVVPNPISSQATISYSLHQSGKVNITVYNSLQQPVKVLVNDFKNAGNYSTVWDAKSGNTISGVYRIVAIIDDKTYATTVQVGK